MKTFLTAALLTATVLSTPAMAFSLSTHDLIPNLTFPESDQETVTQGTANPSK